MQFLAKTVEIELASVKVDNSYQNNLLLQLGQWVIGK